MIKVSAFRWVPPFAQGYVRDLRVRWALEEAGWPYEAVLIGSEAQASERYRDWQPFGQVPAFRDEDLEMFESGAIVLHIAAQSAALSPSDPAGRARVTTWVIAALNSIEPFVQNFLDLDTCPVGERWGVERRPRVTAILERRLAALAARLGARDYLEERFTAGDLMMTTVLRELGESETLAGFPTLDAYYRRCTARPAFVKALGDQMAAFAAHAPAGA